MKFTKTLFIVLAVSAFLLLSASASFADTTNYYYDDWNRTR